MKVATITLILFIIIFSFILILLSNLLKNKIEEIKKIKEELREKQIEFHSIQKMEEEKRKALEGLSQNLQNLQQNITTALENDKIISQQAFEDYMQTLEQKYKDQEEEWDMLSATLKDTYAKLQEDLMAETSIYREELDKIKETRNAAIEALVREKEIEEKLSFYCLQISDKDLADVKILEEVKNKLNNERILCMLIWQTYFQKPMNTLCANVISANTKCGIYKITNIETKECYIGQAVNIAERWKQHAKCGLGIDTPQGNKLYKAMKEYGIWNFSWEVLEECPANQLNEKEKYYISLYDSYNYGYNSNRGNS